MRKGQFLSQAMKDKKKDSAAKLLKHSLLFFRSDGELTEQLLTCSVPTRYTDNDENKPSSQHHGVWGGH